MPVRMSGIDPRIRGFGPGMAMACPETREGKP